MGGVRQFLGLSRAAQTATVEAALTLTGVRVIVRWAPKRLAGKVLRRTTAEGQQSGRASREVQVVVAAIRRTARRLPSTTCLEQAVATWLMLRRRGIPVVVRFGVERADEVLSAHAWVEHAGHAVLGQEGLAEHVAFPSPG